MIALTQNKKVQIVSDTASLEWTSSWVENEISCTKLPSATLNEDQGTTVNGTVDVVPIPTFDTNTESYTIEVEYLSIVNTTVGAAVVSFVIYNGSTTKKTYSVTLQSGDQVIYNEDSGWQVFDKNGATKNTSSTISVNFVTNEIPSGTINSSNVTFTLAHTPTTGSEMVYYNGQLQRPTTDYTITGNTITFVTAPDTGTSIYVSYRY